MRAEIEAAAEVFVHTVKEEAGDDSHLMEAGVKMAVRDFTFLMEEVFPEELHTLAKSLRDMAQLVEADARKQSVPYQSPPKA
ncbi:hypothetical protein [Roseomonas populi]|uniref:Uncharacterized protein n=1 Tax=Roseomonas populi TaxID=3121582 RepID=A0ABT1XAY6_9PROT|nr:hypothetical protein [Roseomonas pecuniae]MCR0985268.1 hypothetical protein [Roseomonas pecuniae]